MAHEELILNLTGREVCKDVKTFFSSLLHAPLHVLEAMLNECPEVFCALLTQDSNLYNKLLENHPNILESLLCAFMELAIKQSKDPRRIIIPNVSPGSALAALYNNANGSSLFPNVEMTPQDGTRILSAIKAERLRPTIHCIDDRFIDCTIMADQETNGTLLKSSGYSLSNAIPAILIAGHLLNGKHRRIKQFDIDEALNSAIAFMATLPDAATLGFPCTTQDLRKGAGYIRLDFHKYAGKPVILASSPKKVDFYVNWSNGTLLYVPCRAEDGLKSFVMPPKKGQLLSGDETLAILARMRPGRYSPPRENSLG